MKNNKGITIVVLVITIVILLILAGISLGSGNTIIKNSKLENIKTNMLLIEGKGKIYVEKASFDLGTTIDSQTQEEKGKRIEKAKSELVGEEIVVDENSENNIFSNNINITNAQIQADNTNYIYYYKLSTENLENMGITKVKSDAKNGWYIIKYDLKNCDVEVYNTKGFENKNIKYYSSNEIENLYI